MRSTFRRVGIPHLTFIVVLTLAGLMLGFAGCQGLPKNVADCPITPTPPADLTIVPPAIAGIRREPGVRRNALDLGLAVRLRSNASMEHLGLAKRAVEANSHSL